jgi:hypothetical protein
MERTEVGAPSDAGGDTITIIRHFRTSDKILSPKFSPIAPPGGEVENDRLSSTRRRCCASGRRKTIENSTASPPSSK